MKSLLSTISGSNILKTTILGYLVPIALSAQSPVVTAWLQNNSERGSYYMTGNSTPISNNILVNCQKVEYSNDFAYIHATGIPAYPTGPFQDGNPSQAQNQSGIYKFPLNPVEETGTKSKPTMGNIGVFINGVALFDYRDGVSWNTSTNSLCGGPGRSPCPGGPAAIQNWNRDAVVAERPGFDCSKGHPAMGNYHHHQNPSAFNLDLNNLSTICNLYAADGLYKIDSTSHSPLIGFAYDGFPIYGAYAYKNADGTGGITRIKSGYRLRDITQRTHSPSGVDVPDGPDVSTTYPLGYFAEDYVFEAHPGEEAYLDQYNGRFCVTPEYPNGTYAYFTTVDENWNSAYPYCVGPAFYGKYANRKVTSVTEATTIYESQAGIDKNANIAMRINVFPNPSQDFIVIQIDGITNTSESFELVNVQGAVLKTTKILAGQTLGYFDASDIYPGIYWVKGSKSQVKVIIE